MRIGRSLYSVFVVLVVLMVLISLNECRPHRRYEIETPHVVKRFLKLSGLTSGIANTFNGIKGAFSGLKGNHTTTVQTGDKTGGQKVHHPEEKDDKGILETIGDKIDDWTGDDTDDVTGNKMNGEDDGLLDDIEDVIDEVTDDIGDVIDEVTDDRKETVDDIAEALEETLENAIELIDIDALKQDLSELASSVLDTFSNITLSPVKFLMKYGYLPYSEDEDFKVIDIVKALLNFQNMYSVRLTGLLDVETLKAMLEPRCGMSDTITRAVQGVEGLFDKVGELLPIEKRGRVKRFVVPGYKWAKKDLTWKIHNYYQSAEISPAVQRRAIYNALNYWQEASGLTFTETSGTADLNIRFVPRDHGDGSQNTFDGPGGVLAHAFYPQSGDAHFDIEERWTDESTTGINLKIVAAHAFGHAFGLGHSDIKGALMAPYYQGFEANYRLPSDDVQAIQKLYGSRDGSVVAQVTDAPPSTTTTAVRVQDAGPAPDSCTVPFRAITQTHDYRIYVYYGRYMWRMSDYGLDDGYPMTIDSSYENPPDNIEAALFSRATYYTYFFKGRDVWVYYGYQFVDKKTITTSGYPSNVQAALTTSTGDICIIQGSSCWIFNEDRLDITSSTPRRLQDLFPGAPTTFDSALRIEGDSNIYFFYGSKYTGYSESQRAVASGYPKNKAGPWMGPACGAQPFTPK